MSGNLSSQNGNGAGSFVISGRRLINKGWLAMDIGAGSGPSVGFKASRTLTERIFCNGGTTLNFRHNGIIPGLVGSKVIDANMLVNILKFYFLYCSTRRSTRQTYRGLFNLYHRSSIINVYSAGI